MRCYACGGSYIEHNGSLELSNKTIGNFNIYLAKYYKCTNCGSLMYPEETLNLISAKEKEIRDNLIRKLPVEEFVTAIEAANLLGITKQAFHKNKRIKRGLIYFTILGKNRLYSKKSVQLFKERNDGRFNLAKPVPKEKSKYYVVVQPEGSVATYKRNQKEHQPLTWTNQGPGVGGHTHSRYIQ